MKIQFKQGKIFAIDGCDTPSTPFGKLVYAAEWLAIHPVLAEGFTGMVDTDTGGVLATTEATNTEHKAKYPTRCSPMMGAFGPGCQPDAKGQFVPFTEYDDLAKAFVALGDDLKTAKEALAKAIGYNPGWGDSLPALIEKAAEVFKENVEALATAEKERNELHFARDFRLQVYNLVEMPATAVADRVFYRIQDLKKAEHRVEELEPSHSQLLADHTTFKGKIARAVGYDTGSPVPSMEILAAQVKVMAETAKLVEVPDAFTTAGVEVSSSVGSDRAVFECTFDWARENWDLFVDKFVWGTVNNPASTESGYIKVVTTGN